MNNEVIKTEGREVMPERLNAIAAEIRIYSTNLLVSIIEIGRRFEEAKNICPRGEWGRWVKEATGYEQSMSENYIKIYKEYGGGQLNLGGDFSDSQSIGNLGVTKLLELTKIPAEERQEFVEENNVTSDTTVKELRALIDAEQKKNAELSEQLSAEKKTAHDDKTMHEAEILHLQLEIRKRDRSISDLETKIKDIEENPAPAENADMEELIREAEESTRLEMEKEVNRLKSENEKAERDIADIKDKLKAEKDRAKQKQTEADELRRKYEEVAAELAKAKKAEKAAGNQELLKINILFGDIQEKIKALKSAFENVQNADLEKKVFDVLAGMITEGAE